MAVRLQVRPKTEKSKKRTRVRSTTPVFDARLRNLIELLPGWYYWEQDKNFRFTVMTGAIFERFGIDPKPYMGKTRWELDMAPLGDGGRWDKHKATLKAHRPFTEFIFKYVSPNGALRFVSTSGQPVFDDDGQFNGYRGISRDVTRRVWRERRLVIEQGVARILADASSVSEAASQIVRTTCEALEWTCGARWECDDQNQTIRCTEIWGAGAPGVDSFLAASRRISPLAINGDGLVRRTCASGKPQWIRNVIDDKSFLRAPEATNAGLHSAFAFPIRSGTKTIGAMEFYSKEAVHQPDDELLISAAYIGSAIGQFCERKRAEEELVRFRTAMNMSGDPIYLIDRATLRYLDFNETACRITGYSREELLKMGPLDMEPSTDRTELERRYDETIAHPDRVFTNEFRVRSRRTGLGIIEAHRRAIRMGDRWMIVSVARNITKRKLAERTMLRSTRMYAMLSATNEAIIHARSPEELYQRVCNAAVDGGKFHTTAVLIPVPDTPWVKVAAVAGSGIQRMREARVSIDGETAEGRGLVGAAFRTCAPCVSNAFLEDERTRPWHEAAREIGVTAGAAVPLRHGDRALGALLFHSNEEDAFDDDIVKLLERMAANVSFALENFERDDERRRAEEQLRASEEKYRAVLENMTEGYFEVDLPGRYTFFNESMRRIHGHSRDEMKGLHYRNYAADEATAKRMYETYKRISRTGEPMPLTEWAFVRKDGSHGVFESSAQLVRDPLGKPIGFRGIARDITHRKQAEEQLRASEEKHRAILENMTEGYFEVDLKGNLTFFNEALERMHGRTREEMRGLNYRAYVDKETAEHIRGIYNRVYRTGEPTRLEDYAIIRKDGAKRILETSIQLTTDASGNPIGFRGLQRDVTERKKIEEALRASEEKYRTILETMQEGYFEVDLAGNYTFCNEALARIHRCSREELLRMNFREYVDAEAADSIRRAYNEIYRTGKPDQIGEWPYVRHDGSRGFFESSAQLLLDADGKPTGFRGVSRDVTQRRREQRLLALEHAVTRGLAEAVTIRKAIQAVLRAICESEYWQMGGFWLYDESARMFRLNVDWKGPGATKKSTNFYMNKDNVLGHSIPAGGLLSRVWESAKPLWVPKISEDPRTVWANRTRATGDPSTFFFPVMADGKPIAILAFSSATVRGPDERLLRTVAVIGNQVGQFIQRKQAEEVLRESEARFRALTHLSSDWYWEQDAEIRFTRVESRRDDIESARTYLLGKRPWEAGYEMDDVDGWTPHRKDLAAHKPYRDIVTYRRAPDGSVTYVSVSGEPIFDGEGRFAGYRGVSREITAQKLAEEKIQYLATHDSLTDLPNRFMFSQLLALAIESAKRYERKFAVFFIDLDRFKTINDTLGHAAGDMMLKEMSLRLTECLRTSDVIARLGGDEFVVLLQEANEPEQVATVARKILSRIMQPLSIAGQECRVTASIGICLYPGDGDDEAALMQNADIAMYLAKEEGKNNFQFYSRNMKAQSLERLTLETRLRRALEQNEFFLNYQAKVDLKTGEIAGVEALLRWYTPDLGSVSPAKFIPIAEETGLIAAIGRWVLRTACAQNVAWQRQGLLPVCMAVNLSARQFNDENLLSDIKNAIEESGMAPELLELEITEGMVMQNAERATRVLSAIKGLGVRLAIDDFGTGYSSLAQIKRYPIDTLKVDRSFIRDIPQDAEDKAITEAIIAMGRTLHLTIVAEGVETREQVQFLRDHNCDQMQGYYFSKPIAADEFAKLLSRQARLAEN